MDIKHLSRSVLALAVITTSPVAAQDIAVEIDLGVSSVSRSGNALNTSGPPLTEIEDYQMISVAGRFSFPVTPNVRLQFGYSGDDAQIPDTVGGAPSSDTYQSSHTIETQIGWYGENTYIGAFYAFGDVAFSPSSFFQDADFEFYGLNATWQGNRWDIAGQIGRLSTEAIDHETLDDATVLSLSGGYLLPNDRTRLSLTISHADGVSDNDSPPVNPTEVTSFGIRVEHEVDIGADAGQASVYAGLDYVDVSEASTAGGTDDASDTVFSVGLTWRFGAAAKGRRSDILAPELPRVARWLGSVPVVD